MIQRTAGKSIEEKLFRGKALLLMGARQVGKTTLVEEVLQNSTESHIDLNGDEPDVRELLARASSTQLKAIIGANKIVFIDEAQRIPDIGLTVKLLVDNFKDIQVIATGSSALELASSIKEPLTGRKYEFNLHPISFAEMVLNHGLLDEKRLLEHRMVFGMYPEIITSAGEEAEHLKLLADSYLYKDLLSLGEIKKPVLLEKILKALALQIGNEVSFTEIGRLVGTSMGTVERYVDLLSKAYIIFQLPSYSKNVRNEIRKGRKIYFYDNGIRNAVLGNFQPLNSRTDTGPLWENYLISERLKFWSNKIQAPGIFFWRSTQQQKIDFIEESAGRLSAFEFKWNPKSTARFPKTFSKAYPETPCRIITPENFHEFLLRE